MCTSMALPHCQFPGACFEAFGRVFQVWPKIGWRFKTIHLSNWAAAKCWRFAASHTYNVATHHSGTHPIWLSGLWRCLLAGLWANYGSAAAITNAMPHRNPRRKKANCTTNTRCDRWCPTRWCGGSGVRWFGGVLVERPTQPAAVV